MSLTRRERLRRAFEYAPMDRPAIYVRTSYPPGDPSYDRLKAYLEETTARKARFTAGRFLSPLPLEERMEPYSEEYDRKIMTLHTPKKDLVRTVFMGKGGRPPMVEKHFLEDEEDAEAYLSLPERVPQGEADDFFRMDREVADAGIVDVALGLNPGGFVSELFGSEEFAVMSIDERDLLHELMERRTREILHMIDHGVTHGIGPFWSMEGEEYIVPPLHGREDFEDFNHRYDKRIIDRLQAAGHRMHIHCHGSVKEVIDLFVEMGAAVLHPFEAPPSGDITAAEAKAAARGKMTLEGNIQIHDMYDHAPEDIREQTEALIRDCFDDGTGLIVCPSASPYIPGGGERCFPQFEAMVETVRGWSG
jgi:hypothetical protein